MIKAKTEHNNTNWCFSPLDSALSGLTNGGSWLFDTRLDMELLQDSLASTLDFYPVYAGRMTSDNCISANNAGVKFEVEQQQQYSCKDIATTWFLPEKLKAKHDIKAFKKGQFPVMAIKVTQIADGTIINIAINHVCADGASLYQFMSDWADIYNKKSISPAVFNQELFPKPKHNKQELTQLLTQNNWHNVGFKDLFSMIFDQIRNKKIIAQPFFISYNFLADLRKQHTVPDNIGNHALLCAYISDMLFCKNKKKYSVASVVDMRGRAIYPQKFIGNAVMNVASDAFDVNAGIGQTAAAISKSLNQSIDKEQLEETFQLYTEAMTLKLPFIPFDIRSTYGKRFSCIIVNNFTSFKVYDICFGKSPIKVFPNDLPDTIKIWPGNKMEEGVYVFLRGNPAKAYKQLFFHRKKCVE